MLDWVGWLSSTQLVLIAAIAASVVAVAVDWRLLLFMLGTAYAAASLLLSSVLPAPLTIVLLVGGFFVVLLLYWTGRHIQEAIEIATAPGGWSDIEHEVLPMSMSFRLLALVVWVIGLLAMEQRLRLPPVDEALMTAALWMIAMSLLAIILTRDPFKTTVAVLIFEQGFELVFLAIEPGLVLIGLLGVTNLLTALVGAYLTIARNLRFVEAFPDPRSPEALARALAAFRRQRMFAEEEAE
ncbi:hypothetical protein ARMA_1528 [Ardenticatena maritima]|uniref:Uncharacterized protein n=1 Tax=Ardenticatena maritima TaxID=872965 RepID=A0A0M8K724_9CHLR|nr:hypothetical protein [Ardenticatena maritima]KPL87811.1 hypothetical protein SE16_09625 [Ardenticatena maritima]GAP63105.1 hypothetical protein ARMA_1528 [Ardenticatena maritima]